MKKKKNTKVIEEENVVVADEADYAYIEYVNNACAGMSFDEFIDHPPRLNTRDRPIANQLS